MSAVALLFFAALLSKESSAIQIASGYERGNGGVGLSCSGESAVGVGVFTLDRIEGQMLYGFESNGEISHSTNENEIVRTILNKLSQKDKTRASKYARWFDQLLEARIFIGNASFSLMNDTDLVMIPDGCQLKQIAVFETDNSGAAVHFYFDQKIWNQLSVLDKAYLLLHEIIYREARLPEINQQTSKGARYLNEWLFSHISEMTQESFIEALKKAQFKEAEYNDMPIFLGRLNLRGEFEEAPLEYFDDSSHRIKSAVLNPSFSIPINGTIFERHCMSLVRSAFSTDFVRFYETGQVKKILFMKDADPGCGDYLGNNVLEFSMDGRLEKASSSEYPLNTP